MNIRDLMDEGLLTQMIEQGYISHRRHRMFDYDIYNYTEKATFDDMWNEATLQCRGLIVDAGGGLIARPFRKFFNYGQKHAADIGLSRFAHVTDKADGSLGIVYLTPTGGVAVATRGSFHSEQAEWATEWLNRPEQHELRHRVGRRGFTDLFEIIYPDNRIVLDYGDYEGMKYIGSMGVTDGEFYFVPPAGADSVEILAYTLGDALRLPDRENAEGVVVMMNDGRAVKIKQEDYLTLHKARFSLTPVRIWEALSEDRQDQFLASLPDEFQDAARKEMSRQAAAVAEQFRTITLAAEAVRYLPTRKEQAEVILRDRKPISAGVFAALDEDWDKVGAVARKAIKPTGPDAHRLIA